MALYLFLSFWGVARYGDVPLISAANKKRTRAVIANTASAHMDTSFMQAIRVRLWLSHQHSRSHRTTSRRGASTAATSSPFRVFTAGYCAIPHGLRSDLESQPDGPGLPRPTKSNTSWGTSGHFRRCSHGPRKPYSTVPLHRQMPCLPRSGNLAPHGHQLQTGGADRGNRSGSRLAGGGVAPQPPRASPDQRRRRCGTV